MPTKTKTEAKFDEAIMDAPEATEEAPVETFSVPAAEEPVQLTGAELMAFYQQKMSEGVSHDEIARKAGYYSITKNGHERVLRAAFGEALLEAQGFPVGKKAAPAGRNYAGFSRARVSGSGILLVSQLATRHVGAEPGAIFSVSYPGDGSIVLTPTGEVKPVVRRNVEEPGTPLLDVLSDAVES